MKKKLVIITWISWSGKTSVQEILLERWWTRPINFTTREPRSEAELDEYVFLTKEQFKFKLENWDFLENTDYNNNYYWVWKHFNQSDKVCVILDPNWRDQVLAQRKDLDYDIISIYLDIPAEVQIQRLQKRWDSEENIRKRMKDLEFFKPNKNSIVMDWQLDSLVIADMIDELI